MTDRLRKKNLGGRPPQHIISIMIENGEEKEARRIVQAAVTRAGSIIAAAPILGLSRRHMFRIVDKLGVTSIYSGHHGANERWKDDDE